jgi:hypothetical protein
LRLQSALAKLAVWGEIKEIHIPVGRTTPDQNGTIWPIVTIGLQLTAKGWLKMAKERQDVRKGVAEPLGAASA